MIGSLRKLALIVSAAVAIATTTVAVPDVANARWGGGWHGGGWHGGHGGFGWGGFGVGVGTGLLLGPRQLLIGAATDLTMAMVPLMATAMLQGTRLTAVRMPVVVTSHADGP